MLAGFKVAVDWVCGGFEVACSEMFSDGLGGFKVASRWSGLGGGLFLV